MLFRSEVFFKNSKGLVDEQYCYKSLVENRSLAWLQDTAEWLEMFHWLHNKSVEFMKHQFGLALQSGVLKEKIDFYYDNLISGGFENTLSKLTLKMMQDQSLAIAHLPFIADMTYSFYGVPVPIAY